MATVKCARGKRGSPSHEMDEYIKRKTVIDLITRRYENPEICTQEINSIPDADVAPVVHARWIRPHWRNSNYCCDCSECGGEAMHRDYQWDKNGIYPICPNCGAKMDGGAENG